MKTNKRPLFLILHGFDDRSLKTMKLFLQGPCRGAAAVVTDQETADVFVFDADVPGSKRLLENQLQKEITKALIVISLNEFSHKGVIYLKKPVATDSMLKVLEQAKNVVAKLQKQATAGVAKAQVSETVDASSNNNTKADEVGISNYTSTHASSVNAHVKEGDVLKELDDWFNFD